jgi:hypothetical protein
MFLQDIPNSRPFSKSSPAHQPSQITCVPGSNRYRGGDTNFTVGASLLGSSILGLGISATYQSLLSCSDVTQDKHLCLLTSAGRPVEVAHIYPYSMINRNQQDIFWRSLQYFWSDERITRWKNANFTDGRTEDGGLRIQKAR